MRQIKANKDLKYKYKLPKKPFGIRDDGLFYRFTKKFDSQFKHNNGGFLAHMAVAIFIASFLAAIVSTLYPVYHLFEGGFAISQLSLPIVSAIPGAFIIGYPHWLDVSGAPYIDGRNHMLKLLKQPMINTERNAVKHLYDFIDVERSTDHELVFYNDTDQDFVFADDVTLDAPMAGAVLNYSKSECLSNKDIVKRIRALQSVEKRKRDDIQRQYEHQFHKNTVTPVDTPYYRSLKLSRQSIDAEIEQLTLENIKHIDENAKIIERINTK